MGSKTNTMQGIVSCRKVSGKSFAVPIAGTTKFNRLEENLGAVNVELTAEGLQQTNSAASNIAVPGARYAEAGEKLTNR